MPLYGNHKRITQVCIQVCIIARIAVLIVERLKLPIPAQWPSVYAALQEYCPSRLIKSSCCDATYSKFAQFRLRIGFRHQVCPSHRGLSKESAV